MQMMVPRYLEVSLESFTREQEKMRQQMAQAFGVNVPSFGPMEEQVRRNMEMFEKTFAMFSPFARRDTKEPAAGASNEPNKPAASTSSEDIDVLKRQIEEMQRRIDKISDKD